MSEDKSRLKHTRRGIEVVITGLTRKRSDFSEPSAQKILEFFGFLRLENSILPFVLSSFSLLFPEHRRGKNTVERYRSGHNGPDSKTSCPFGTLLSKNPLFYWVFRGLITEYFSQFSSSVLSVFRGLIFEISLERYRSGHNGPDSKCALALAVFSAGNP